MPIHVKQSACKVHAVHLLADSMHGADSKLCPATGAIASLSLAGHAVMEFRQEGQAFALLLPPRSLLVMAGPARYCWQHYIPHRKADLVNGCLLPRAQHRTSFTFRQVFTGVCMSHFFSTSSNELLCCYACRSCGVRCRALIYVVANLVHIGYTPSRLHTKHFSLKTV